MLSAPPYWKQTASLRIMNELSDDIRTQRGIGQGCVAFPTLFNLYTEKTYSPQGVMSKLEATITTIRYADDTALLAGNEKELFRVNK